MLSAWQDVKVVQHGSGVLAIFSGTDYLLAVDSSGGTDTVRIPICRRRGAPKVLLDRLFAARPGARPGAGPASRGFDDGPCHGLRRAECVDRGA